MISSGTQNAKRAAANEITYHPIHPNLVPFRRRRPCRKLHRRGNARKRHRPANADRDLARPFDPLRGTARGRHRTPGMDQRAALPGHPRLHPEGAMGSRHRKLVAASSTTATARCRTACSRRSKSACRSGCSSTFTTTSRATNSGDFHYQSFNVELRWALADWGKIWGNPTLYAEYKFADEHWGPDVYEFKLLLGDQFAPRWHWGVNFVWEAGDRRRPRAGIPSHRRPQLYGDRSQARRGRGGFSSIATP